MDNSFATKIFVHISDYINENLSTSEGPDVEDLEMKNLNSFRYRGHLLVSLIAKS